MRRVHRVAAGLAAALVLVPVAGCGPDPSESTKSPSPSSKSAKQRAAKAVLPNDALPAKWKRASVQDHFENPGRPTYCGVVAVPVPVSAGRVDLYARRSTGPFVLQYTYVASKTSEAKAVLARLKQKAKTCKSDKGTNGERYTVRPVTDVTDIGNETVGFHYRVHTGYTSGVVVFRRGDIVVTLVDMGPPAVPYPTVKSMARTVDSRVK